MDASRSSRTPSSLVPASLQISRERAARDMVHEITELPLEEVFSNYLPPVLQADIDECHSRLQQSGVIANGRWSCFQKDPKDRLDEEEFIFEGLETLFQSVVDVKKSACHSGDHSCDNTVRLVQTASRTTICEVNGGDSNIDFALEVTKSTVPEAIRKKTEFVGKIFSADVAANGEVKRANDFITRYEDAKKAVHGAAASFGFFADKLNPMEVTIENTQMRIWFYSRSHSVVSEPFNFVEDTKSFVRFVLAFGFASDYPARYCIYPKARRLQYAERTFGHLVAAVPLNFWLAITKEGLLSERPPRTWVLRSPSNDYESASSQLSYCKNAKLGARISARRVEKHQALPKIGKPYSAVEEVEELRQLIQPNIAGKPFASEQLGC
ncbi:hypothetical protein FISHEDRAFT_79133 [Fistulina hepatica ATCC 64428]|uniref:Fungal-type protein kinase domain-containing protein n=1 Tax=Fistulina hepatica ATCC 64428 TaxID=1128425 RepID=A0A0D6ZZ47_9AGAR|nr:hypothetical protein FISHEDRAFT_79133 [Fistulina hepatica ATCC 64428]